MSTLGSRLRQLRRERACTLQEVSDGSGLTPSFLSRLERGIVNISVGNLRRVAAFFGVPITFFFTEELQPYAIVVRAGDRRQSDDGEICRASLLPEAASQLAAELVTIAPGVGRDELLPAVSRAIYYVLAGELTCQMGGQTYRITPGDVLYQRRPTAFAWTNDNEGETVVLAASLRPEEQ